MFALIVPMPTMAGADINAGVYLVADINADTPQGGPTGRDEKQPDQALEREKPAGSEHKSDFIINVWPVKPQDNVKSLHEMKEENKHTPPDRF